MSDAPLNRHEEVVTIKIIKVFYDQDPSHWEVEVRDHNGEEIGSATGPTFYNVYDSCYELITGDSGAFDEQHNSWVDFNSNKPS
jgi:hypothetical protein